MLTMSSLTSFSQTLIISFLCHKSFHFKSPLFEILPFRCYWPLASGNAIHLCIQWMPVSIAYFGGFPVDFESENDNWVNNVTYKPLKQKKQPTPLFFFHWILQYCNPPQYLTFFLLLHVYKFLYIPQKKECNSCQDFLPITSLHADGFMEKTWRGGVSKKRMKHCAKQNMAAGLFIGVFKKRGTA